MNKMYRLWKKYKKFSYLTKHYLNALFKRSCYMCVDSVNFSRFEKVRIIAFIYGKGDPSYYLVRRKDNTLDLPLVGSITFKKLKLED